MPGWILVANRFSFLTAVRANGGVLRAVASLVCLVVLTGCSNIRQQSLELPLPILPSQAAVDSKAAAAPVLPAGDVGVVADSSIETGALLGSAAFENDFTASEFEQASSVQSFLSPGNTFKPPELRARFVGVLDETEMTDVTLKAVSRRAAPAPAIETTLVGSDLGRGEATDACRVTGAAECACCKEKVVPKLAAVEPINPEQLPGLFGTDQQRAGNGNFVPVQAMLQPLRSTTNGPEADATPAAKITALAVPVLAVPAKEIVNSPIRLTAMPDRQRLKARLPSLTTVPDQPKNNAKQLIRITPDAFSEFKAGLARPTAELVEKFKASPVIKVSPIMDLNSVTREASPMTAFAAARASEPVDSIEIKSQAGFIPVSPSVIRVSADPFNSLVSSFPKTVSVKAKPFVPPVRVQPVVRAQPPVRVQPPVSKLSTAEMFAADFRASAPVASEISDRMEQVRPLVSPDIDPLSDINDLPDMVQIEQELADFELDNTFNPSTVIHSDRMDPAVLLAKLDGPPKKIAAPVATVVAIAPDKDLIAQQLAAQSSALSEIQNAIKQLKPEPVVVVDEVAGFTLGNAAFCSKISGFGQFKPFVANTFSGSQKTLLYCEVENQTSKQFTNVDGSQQFETVLHGSVTIYDVNDRVVQTEQFPVIKDIARQQRRDFYVYFPVRFNELVSGDYRLELSVEDVVGNDTAVLRPSMRFSVR